jgi:SpoIID/LytB domain protein
MHRLGICFLLCLVGVFYPAYSGYYSDIPQATLQAAKESINLNYLSPQSKIVRVGIGNQNFSSYVWDKVSVYGTGEYEIYNNKTYISTFDSNNVVDIKTVGRIFVLTDCENNVIAKVSGPIVFKSDYGFLGIKDLKRAGKDALYRGQIELIPAVKEGQFHIVNSLDVEQYLKGVVPNEMPVKFGLEALKAQSVAARNYVLSPRIKANPNYDVVDSVASQVYFGANTEKDLSNQAVHETSGIVALYNWNLILALYSSTAGGYTENYENAFSDPQTRAFPARDSKPYLRAKPDYESFKPLNQEEDAYEFYKTKPKSFDIRSPYYRWTREWTQEELQTEVQNHIAAQSDAGFVSPKVEKGQVIDKILRLNVLERGESGKIMKIQIETESENYIVEKELVIRRLFTVAGKALPSANAVFEQEFDEDGNLLKIRAYGGGFGHGVGLSQYGAGYMGEELKCNFQDILKHYYTGISLGSVPVSLSGELNSNTATQTFFTKDGKAKLVVDNKFKVEYLETVINGVTETLELNRKERYDKIDLSNYLLKGLNTIVFNYPKYLDKNKSVRFYIEIAGEDELSDK